ncbi:MAG: response regulator [Gammaproteobacteria bacterium]|nr:response regulator [Gammaproteobacteria bacterium]
MTNVQQLLIIEDDVTFAATLTRRLERQGFTVQSAHTTEDGLTAAMEQNPQYVLLDMKIGSDNGIQILPQLRASLPNAKIILLTGYASIATAVDAIKAGADDYLTKPVDSTSLINALIADTAINKQSSTQQTIQTRMSPARLEWEHIQQALKANNGNISATARELGMHRRTLQRKLAKKPHMN